MLLTGHLTGAFEYDDGVYFAATWYLLHGVMPYSRFVMVQPPGITIMLAPFVGTSFLVGQHLSLVLTRMAVLIVSAMNIGIVGWMLRRRSPAAAVFGSLIMAVYPANIMTSSSISQEPFLVLFCLLALELVLRANSSSNSDKKLIWAGVLLALAVDIKLWAGVLVLVIISYLLFRRRYRGLISLCLGGLAGAAVFILPFVLVAPGQFMHDVLFSQFNRSLAMTYPIFARVAMLGGQWWSYLGTPFVIYDLAIGGLVVAFIVVVTVALRRIVNSVDADFIMLALCMSILTCFMFLWSFSFYYHYADFFIPWAAIAFASSLDLLGVFRRMTPSQTLFVVGALAILVTILPFKLPRDSTPASSIVLSKDTRCLVSVSIEYTVVAGRLQASHGCPVIVDSYGVMLVDLSDRVPQSIVEATWLADLRHARCVIITAPDSPQLLDSRQVMAYVHLRFPIRITKGITEYCRAK